MVKNIILICSFVVFTGCGKHSIFVIPGSSSAPSVGAGSLTINKMTVNNLSSDSFKVSTRFTGDQSASSVVELTYCNLTDSPGCEATISLGFLTKGLENFYIQVIASDLLPTDDPGDRLRLKVTKSADNTGTNELEYVINLTASTVNHAYRSVGPGSTTALATGLSNSLTISGTTAVFETNLPSNIGVGDVIQYDSNLDTTIDSLVVIQERLDSQTFIVKTPILGAPTPTISNNSWSLFRAYTSLSLAESGTENLGIDATVRNFESWGSGNDLVTLDQVWNIAMYGDGDDTDQATFSSWTTSEENYIRVYAPHAASEVGVSQRHQGVWDSSKARMRITNGYGIYILEDFVQIDGIQFELILTGTETGKSAIRTNINENVTVINNLVKGSITSTGFYNYGLQIYSGTAGSKSTIANNIVYGFETSPRSMGIYLGGSGDYFVYNNTIHGAEDCYLGTVNTIFKNNIAQNCLDEAYRGPYHTDSTNNLSSLTDAAGSNPINSVNLSFNDAANGDYNLVATDIDAIGTGVNLLLDPNYAFNFDMLNNQRQSSWSLGPLLPIE